MDLSARSDLPAFRCPVCSSRQHEQVQTPLADGTLVPVPVHRCFNCHVYFLAPSAAEPDDAATGSRPQN